MNALPKSWVQLGKHRLIATHLNTYDLYLWPLSAFDLEISNNRDNQGLAKPEIQNQRKVFKLGMVLNQVFLSTITLPWSSVLCFLNMCELQVAFNRPLLFHSSGDRHSPQVLPVCSKQPESRCLRFEVLKVKFATSRTSRSQSSETHFSLRYNHDTYYPKVTTVDKGSKRWQ